jgi:hypothetical protein
MRLSRGDGSGDIEACNGRGLLVRLRMPIVTSSCVAITPALQLRILPVHVLQELDDVRQD